MADLAKLKKLRTLTKAGIMDCRRALEQSKGDLAKAKAWLKQKGKLRAAKKKDRATKAGLIEAYIHNSGQVGSLLKLGCETDFVAHNAEFKKLAHELCMQVAAMNPKNINDLLEQEYIRDPKIKVKDLINEVIAKTGENIKIQDFCRQAF